MSSGLETVSSGEAFWACEREQDEIKAMSTTIVFTIVQGTKKP